MTNMQLQGAKDKDSRKRRAHKKSRRGCGNCKLRRVKCDEVKPTCKQCIDYGVSCSYDSKAADLQMSFAGAACIDSESQQKPRRLPLPDQRLQGMVAINNRIYSTVIEHEMSNLRLDAQSMERLGRFQMRTALSIGTEDTSKIYQKEILRLAFSHSYLMHFVQIATSIHDRYLSTTPNLTQTAAEAHHWSQAVTLFNQKISKPVHPSERDAIWATAALLGIISICSVETRDPEEAWPLKQPEPSDLGWLGISQYKLVIFETTAPLRPESVFRTVAQDYMKNHGVFATTKSGIGGFPPAFVSLLGLDNNSSADNSPYYNILDTLVPLLDIECSQSTIMKFLTFISHMNPKFKTLIEGKDPRALLLLAYWYAKVCRAVWWIARRALVECQATCLYLERYHAADTAIQDLLPYPKMLCGLKA